MIQDEIVYSQIKPLYKEFQKFYQDITAYLESLNKKEED